MDQLSKLENDHTKRRFNMNSRQKHLSLCVFTIAACAALLYNPSTGLAQTAPPLGDAASFAVLGKNKVTCTNSTISGNVGVSAGPFVNTTCVTGTLHESDLAANNAQVSLRNAYNNAVGQTCTQTIGSAAFTNNTPALGPLAPGVYCFPAAVTFTNTTLTLDGSTNPKGIWIFKVGAALTGSGFQVVMTNGAKPCNVYWAVGEAVTLSTSTLLPLFQGNILASNPTPVSPPQDISITSGSVVGSVLGQHEVTLITTSVLGCDELSTAAGCKVKKHKKHDKHKKHKGDDHDDDDDDDDDDDENHDRK